MARVLVTETYLEDIGDAIRSVNGLETTYKPSEMAAVIDDFYIEPTGTKSITANGTGIDVKDYASADVNVPNSYSASDEGKVVDEGELVAQGSQTITENGTYDTTLISELIANISGGGEDDKAFLSTTAGDYLNGWYSSRKITRVLGTGAKLLVAPYHANNNYVAGAFYTLVDYGNATNVCTGDYPTKVEIPNVDIPNYGVSTVYAYGGMNGSGNKGNVLFYDLEASEMPDNMSTASFFASAVGSNDWNGMINAENYGNAFNSMSNELKSKFYELLIKTLD